MLASTSNPTLQNSPAIFGGKSLELLSFLIELGICTSKTDGKCDLISYIAVKILVRH